MIPQVETHRRFSPPFALDGMIYERIIYPTLFSEPRERTADRTYHRAMKLRAHGKHMVIRRFDSSRLGFVNGTDVLRNLCDARRVSATGGEQASAHLDALSLNSMRARVAYLYLSVCMHIYVFQNNPHFPDYAAELWNVLKIQVFSNFWKFQVTN